MLALKKYMPYLAKYEWFTTARRAKVIVTGRADEMLTLPLMFWPLWRPAVKVEVPRRDEEQQSDEATGQTDGAVVECGENEATGTNLPGDNLIDRFLEHGDYRIVVPDESAAPQADDVDICIEVEVDLDPALVTAELAEIYRAQGLHDKADEIYRLLAERDADNQ